MNPIPDGFIYTDFTDCAPADKIRQAARLYFGAYGRRPNLAAIPRAWPALEVDGLKIVRCDLGPHSVLVGVAEGGQR